MERFLKGGIYLSLRTFSPVSSGFPGFPRTLRYSCVPPPRCDPDPKEKVGRSMKKSTFGACTLLAVLTSILLAACGGTGPVEETGQPSPLSTQTKPGGPGKAPAPQTGAEQGGIPPQLKTIEEKRRFLTTAYMKNARAAFDLGEYDKAKQFAASALDVDPNNQEARDFMRKMAALLGERPESAEMVQKRFTDEAKARIEKTRMMVEELLIKAEVALNNKNYDQAVQRCEDALLAIRYNPYIQKNSDLEKKVKAKKAAILQAIQDRKKAEAARLARAAKEKLREREQEEAIRKLHKVRRLFEQANIAFMAKRYEDCSKNLEILLQIDPGNQAARKLLEVTRDASHENNKITYERRWKTEWARTFDDLMHADIPQMDSVVFDRRHWREVLKRKPIESFQVEQSQISVEDQAVLDKLNSTMAEYSFQDAEIDAWVGYFQQVTEVNFYISPKVRELDAEETSLTNVHFPRMAASKALNLITRLRSSLRWKVEDGVVQIITTEENVGRVYTKFYEVRDLVAKLQNFVGKEIYITPPGAQIEQPEIPEPQPIVMEGETLRDTIEQNIGIPNAFEMPGASLSLHGNGVIIARCTKEVHDRIKKLLSDLRINIGILVNIEARFLKVEDKFLEEIGVDLRGLGDDASRGVPGKGLQKKRPRPNVRFDDFGPGITATTPRSLGTGNDLGIFYDNGRDGDLMGRTENLFDMALGSKSDNMNNAGGLSLQYTYLDDTEIEAILRAVSKRERVEQINAPNILVFNSQRANITLTHQISYVKDFDVEIAQAAAVANPVVAMVSDGVVLDVHPVVSADRRFITMELRPTLAQLTLPIPTYTTTLGVGQAITIQQPKLQIQRVRTTVTIPDGGTLLLGGMKISDKQDYRSGIPFLQDLPIISFLFSRQGTYRSHKKVIILLRASIVIPPEMEPALTEGEF